MVIEPRRSGSVRAVAESDGAVEVTSGAYHYFGRVETRIDRASGLPLRTHIYDGTGARIWEIDFDGVETIAGRRFPTRMRARNPVTHELSTLEWSQIAVGLRVPDEAFDLAIANVRGEPPPAAETVDADGVQLRVMAGDSFYVASRALFLDELLDGAPDGVFAVPNRHVLLWYAVTDLSVVQAMSPMFQIAANLFREGPGSISDQLYWWRGGEPTSRPPPRFAFGTPACSSTARAQRFRRSDPRRAGQVLGQHTP